MVMGTELLLVMGILEDDCGEAVELVVGMIIGGGGFVEG